MPYDNKKRAKVFKKILNNKKSLFFACENLVLTSKKDIIRIEKIWSVKKISNKCLKSRELQEFN